MERRRRVDDWKTTSGTKAPLSAFTELCTSLGYTASEVMSVRLNAREVIVTHRLADGMPISTRHEVAW